MAAKIDIKRNSRMRLTRDGYRAERIATISNVSGTAEEVLYNAINDSQLPDIGDAHPEVADITLQSLDCQPLGGGRFRVVMTYFKDSGQTTTRANAEVRLQSSLAVEEENVDSGGGAMTATYLAGSTLVKQVFTAEVERPRATFEFEYTVAAIPHEDINAYMGRVNKTAWNGYARGTILCAGIDAQPAGADYRVTYTFAYRAGGWDYQGKLLSNPYAVNPVSIAPGDPDYEIDYDNQTKSFSMYFEAELNDLGFTFDSVNYIAKYNKGKIQITGTDAELSKA